MEKKCKRGQKSQAKNLDPNKYSIENFTKNTQREKQILQQKQFGMDFRKKYQNFHLFLKDLRGSSISETKMKHRALAEGVFEIDEETISKYEMVQSEMIQEKSETAKSPLSNKANQKQKLIIEEECDLIKQSIQNDHL